MKDTSQIARMVFFCVLLTQPAAAKATATVHSMHDEQLEVHTPAIVAAVTADTPADEANTLRPGQVVEITDGAFAGMTGEVKEINSEDDRVTVEVDVFGRPTLVELSHAQFKIRKDD